MNKIQAVVLALVVLSASQVDVLAQESSQSSLLQVVPGLELRSTLVYPEGQGPAWDGVNRVVAVDVVVKNAKGAERSDKRGLYLTSDGGTATFVFEYADGAACAFDIQNLPSEAMVPGAISELKLSKSRLHANQSFGKEPVQYQNELEAAIDLEGWKDIFAGPPSTLTPGSDCSLGFFPFGKWDGGLKLSSDELGNLQVEGTLNQLGGRTGVRQTISFGPIALANRNFPKSPRELLVAQTAEGTLASGVLPAMDPTPLPERRASRIGVSMRYIDDIGFIAVYNKQAGEMVQAVEWTAPQNFGYADVDVTPRLKKGENIIVLGLHNKAFSFGVGKWSYDFSVLVDGQSVWQASRSLRASGVGMRFWKAFLVVVAPDGTMSVRSLTGEEGERMEPMLTKVNAELVENFGMEQSSMAFASRVVSGLIMSGFYAGLNAGEGSTSTMSEQDRQEGFMEYQRQWRQARGYEY